METREILTQLRTKRGLTQEDLAQVLHVTRQAVSRWETGKTTPDHQTLKQLSALYDVSINTLLGSPRRLICQCCGMPMEESDISREPDGTLNEKYCNWCYIDGRFVYTNIKDLLDFLVKQVVNPDLSPEENRAFLEHQLRKLTHWKSQDA